jgi:hypothetical protein
MRLNMKNLDQIERYDKHTENNMVSIRMGKFYFAVLLEETKSNKAYINVYKYQHMQGNNSTYTGIGLEQEFKV